MEKTNAGEVGGINPKSIGLIIGSTRNPRVGPKLASHILSILKPHVTPEISITTIDLIDWPLPLFDESVIPGHITTSDGYSKNHTKAWSKEISKHHAFIFLTPQYNWSIPAVLKNALDYLYNEWKGKPAMIVSYGSRGGLKGAEALKVVLEGLRMKRVDGMVGYPLNVVEGGEVAAQKEGILIEGIHEVWKSQDEALVKSFGDLVSLLK